MSTIASSPPHRRAGGRAPCDFLDGSGAPGGSGPRYGCLVARAGTAGLEGETSNDQHGKVPGGVRRRDHARRSGGREITTAPLKSILQFKDKTPDVGDQVSFKWSKGEATQAADFGDPLTTDGYALC